MHRTHLPRPARPHWLAAALLVIALTSPAARADTETRYTITIQTQVGGHLLRRMDDQGTERTDFSYRDNGRGPDLRETITTSPDGTVQGYTVDGTSTFGAAIHERFRRDGDRVEWTSTVDRGTQPAPPQAQYLPVESSPAWFARLVRAVWQQPDHSAPALPAGRFTVRRIDGMTVAAASGASARVGLYALVGADLTPGYLWLREDADLALFAVVWPGWTVVEQGFEAQAPALLARTQQAQRERLGLLAAQLAQPLPGLTVIRHVRWFDADAARLRGPADVVVHDGRIRAILPPDAPLTDVQQVIDGQGRTLLPGLFDMHGHVYTDDGLLHLAAGVTTVRDMGNVNDELAALKTRWDRGNELGPWLVPLGFIEGKSAFSSNSGILAGTLDEAKAAVDWYALRGYRQVKLYNSIKPDWAKPLAAYAHARGLRVGGHVPAFARADDMMRAGYDELSHINQLMLNFLVQPGDDTRTLLRFTKVGDGAGTVDLDSPRVKAFIALLKRRGTAVDPTAATFEAMFTQRNGEPNPSMAAVADHLPVALRRNLLANSMDVNAGNATRYRRSYASMLAMIGRLHQAGVPLLAGTDDVAGFALHRELELYVQAGIAPAQVLQIATRNGARHTGTLAEAGTIAVGKRADLLLVDGDPTQRISDIRRVSLVLKGGTALAPAAIYEALGIQPFVPAAAISIQPAKAN
jgi:cytosine/adenosine deaminase-related metal-dependent hydrolase